jgi:hypothetical protein
MPYHPGLLPSRLQRGSWFRRLASSQPNDEKLSLFFSQNMARHKKVVTLHL